MTLLDNALALAVKIHTGQTDKADRPYILHPLTLMMQMDSDDERITAVLHDTIEDSGLTLEQLQQQLNLPDHIAEALDLLTHDKASLTYDKYIERLRPNPLARKVKLADLRHNMDPLRLEQFGKKEQERMAQYHRAWRYLTGV
jgi:(p)ppGpp synthase/HD superfamily hydrolase